MLQTVQLDGRTNIRTEGRTTEGARGLFGDQGEVPKKKKTSTHFQSFWDAYPDIRRTAKHKCEKLWQALALDESVDQVMSGLAKWKASEQWQKQNGAFVMAPHRWLSERDWETPPPSKGPTNRHQAKCRAGQFVEPDRPLRNLLEDSPKV
jgi:hypothetical protein